MTSTEKLEVARALARLGVDVIEAGFPAASPDDLIAVQRIAAGMWAIWFRGDPARAGLPPRARACPTPGDVATALADLGIPLGG